MQIEAFAEAEGLQISGYYAAAENFDENGVERAPGLKIADKIVDLTPNACLVMVSVLHFEPIDNVSLQHLSAFV